MKAVLISLLIGCSALRFMTEENDPDMMMHLMAEKNYAESIKTKARIDYFRGDEDSCTFKVASKWKASFTVEKNGLRKGSRAKVDSCYRVEKWWVNQGISTSDGALRGQLKKDEKEHTGGIKFTCDGDKLYTNFYTTDDCNAAHDTAGHIKNRHVAASAIEADWKGCVPDRDAAGAVLKYKPGDYTSLEEISAAVLLVKTASESGDENSDANKITRLGAIKAKLTPLFAEMTANTKTLLGNWNPSNKLIVEGRGAGLKLLGLYQPDDKEFTAADLQTSGVAATAGAIDFRRQFNFKPPLCR